MPKKLILYDLDGTLVDTREDIAAAANHMLRETGRPPLGADQIASYVGRGLHHLVKSCLKAEDPKLIEQASKIYRAHYAEHMLDHSRLYPGAREMLEHFRGRKQAVLTNKPNPFSARILEALGVAGFLCAVIAGDSGYPKKPDPAAIRALLARETVRPDEAVLVGDSPIDVETARNAGVYAAILTHGFTAEDELKSSAPDLLVPDFPALLERAKKDAW